VGSAGRRRGGVEDSAFADWLGRVLRAGAASAIAVRTVTSISFSLTMSAMLMSVVGVVGVVGVVLGGCSREAPAGGPLDVTVVLGEVGTAPGQFSFPRCLDSDGASLWVIDKLARVQRMDPVTGACVGGWPMPASELGKPTGITAWRAKDASGGEVGDADVLVLIADTHYHRVLIYRAGALVENADDARAPTGELVAQFGAYGEGPGQFIYPTKVTVLPSADGTQIARLYVAEYGGNDRVSVWEPTSPGRLEFQAVKTFGTFGGSASKELVQFNRPQSMALTRGHDELVISDACNHRIGRFTLDGGLIAWHGGGASGQDPGQAPGQFNYPYGLTMLDDSTLVVAEFGNSRVQRIDVASGKSLGILGQRGRRRGELATPWATAVVDGTLFVLDSGNNRMQGVRVPTGVRTLAAAAMGAAEVTQDAARQEASPQ
jgi:hypothetical protein